MVSMNSITAGADLSKPKISVGWVIGASVAVAVLMVAAGIGGYLYRTGKGLVGDSTKTVTDAFSGVFGDGT